MQNFKASHNQLSFFAMFAVSRFHTDIVLLKMLGFKWLYLFFLWLYVAHKSEAVGVIPRLPLLYQSGTADLLSWSHSKDLDETPSCLEIFDLIFHVNFINLRFYTCKSASYPNTSVGNISTHVCFKRAFLLYEVCLFVPVPT